jgi:2-polyprenyl-3-methyl-5-hydroxy-6-metoxy-1,4-benzoquinol methylase
MNDGNSATTSPFDDQAATWDDDPAKVARAAEIAETIAAVVPLDPSMRLLEYGAGTGLLSQALRDRVGPVTLADSSAGMRAVVQSKIDAGALPGARVWSLDLEVDPAPDERFDVIVTVLTLHHISRPATVLHAFAGLLETGGHLGIADLEKEDGSFHGADFDGHHGFERDALAADLDRAGFSDVRFTACTPLEKHGGSYPVFLATATRR